MEKVGYEKYKEWIDSLLEECTDENRVKGKELEIITSTIPENMGTEVYKLGEKSDNLLYVYIKRNEEGGVCHLYVYKEIANQSIFIEQPFFCYYNITASQHGEKMELVQFSAPGFATQYKSNSNKPFCYCKDVTEIGMQNSSKKPIDFSDLDEIIKNKNVPSTEFREDSKEWLVLDNYMKKEKIRITEINNELTDYLNSDKAMNLNKEAEEYIEFLKKNIEMRKKFIELYYGIDELHLRKKLFGILRAKAKKQETEQGEPQQL